LLLQIGKRDIKALEQTAVPYKCLFFIDLAGDAFAGVGLKILNFFDLCG